MIAAPDPDDAGAYLACAVDRGSVIAAALHSSGGVLVTGGPRRRSSFSLPTWRSAYRRPKGVVGPLASCEAFARVWRERTGFAHALRFQLRHFALTDTPTAPRASGNMRPPERGEHELIADWQEAFLVEAGLPDEAARVRANLARRMERGLVRVWDDDGAVCFAGYAEIDEAKGKGGAHRAGLHAAGAARLRLCIGAGCITVARAAAEREAGDLSHDRPRKPDLEQHLPEDRLPSRRHISTSISRPLRRPIPRDAAPFLSAAARRRRGSYAAPWSAAHHATHVLRLKRGDALTLFDGEGGEFHATLERVDARAVVARLGGRELVERESPLAITLVQGLTAAGRMDTRSRKPSRWALPRSLPSRQRAA